MKQSVSNSMNSFRLKRHRNTNLNDINVWDYNLLSLTWRLICQTNKLTAIVYILASNNTIKLQIFQFSMLTVLPFQQVFHHSSHNQHQCKIKTKLPNKSLDFRRQTIKRKIDYSTISNLQLLGKRLDDKEICVYMYSTVLFI